MVVNAKVFIICGAHIKFFDCLNNLRFPHPFDSEPGETTQREIKGNQIKYKIKNEKLRK